MQKAHELFREKDVAVLAISIDGTGERAVKPFMAQHGYTFLSLIDQTMAVARQFGVRSVPTTYVVNHEGMIVGAGFGPLDLTGPEFTHYLTSLLSGS